MDKLVFDIGATNTKFALMSTEGEILARESVRTDYSCAEAFFDNMAVIAGKYQGRGDAIAISTNGRMEKDGNTYRAYTMSFLKDKNLKEEMEQRTGLPVTILNDGFSATLGEWWKGSGQGSKNLLVIVLGSGMGGGLILNDKLYQGERLNAAMIFGMLSAHGNSSYDLAGITTAFVMLLYQMSAVKQIPMQEMTGQKFFEYVAEGDPAAMGMLEAYCETIATIIYNSALLLDLDRTVVTGGLSEQPVLMNTIRRKLKEIPDKLLHGPAEGFLDTVAFDARDFQVEVTQGKLALDANLYGALYYLLNEVNS